MAEAPAFEVALLPHSHPDPSTWRALIQHQKTLRLQSLHTSPEAFGSTYEREAAFSDEDWEKRLQNPLAYTFVAYPSPHLQAFLPQSPASQPSSSDLVTQQLAQSSWVGSAVLLGPVALFPEEVQRKVSPGSFDPHNNSDGGDRKTVEFVISAVWVSPAIQRKGLGRRLVEVSVAHAKAMAEERGAEDVVLKIVVVMDNATALGAYEAWGFVKTRMFQGPDARKALVELAMRVVVD